MRLWVKHLRMQSQSTRAGTGGEYGFLLLSYKEKVRWVGGLNCMLLSLCLWSLREEEQIEHLYGLFLGLKTDGGGWDFKEIRLKKWHKRSFWRTVTSHCLEMKSRVDKSTFLCPREPKFDSQAHDHLNSTSGASGLHIKVFQKFPFRPVLKSSLHWLILVTDVWQSHK